MPVATGKRGSRGALPSRSSSLRVHLTGAAVCTSSPSSPAARSPSRTQSSRNCSPGCGGISGPITDVATHFTPRYRPRRQRIAFVPDGDFLEAIRSGKASVVTGEIESFTEAGILLKSGETLETDIIITATGFNLNVMGDIDFNIDGEPLNFSNTVTYRGMMFTGVPNMAWVFG
jgi:cation diffusion facilitator CzcD-associated flavoprotein CzcO